MRNVLQDDIVFNSTFLMTASRINLLLYHLMTRQEFWLNTAVHRSLPYGQSHTSKVGPCTNRKAQAVASLLIISHLVPTLMIVEQ